MGQGRGRCVPGLYLAICLPSPSLILAGEAGLPEARGGLTHLDLGLLGGRWRRSLDSGCLSPVEKTGFLACLCVRRVQGEKSRTGERKQGIAVTPPTKA